ncbi:MAG TPA: hypothetical protein VIX91_13535, partial [Candidatus Acidoferrum sp.]
MDGQDARSPGAPFTDVVIPSVATIAHACVLPNAGPASVQAVVTTGSALARRAAVPSGKQIGNSGYVSAMPT